MDVIKMEQDSDGAAEPPSSSGEHLMAVTEPPPFTFCAVKSEREHFFDEVKAEAGAGSECSPSCGPSEDGDRCEDVTSGSRVTDEEVPTTKEEETKAESEMSFDRIRSVSGRPLSAQSREIVYNVATYLQNQKKQFKLRYNVAKSTSEATCVSEATVYEILKEGKASKAKGCLKFSTPSGKKKSRKKKIEVNDLMKLAIRRKVHEFYTVKKAVPTIRTLQQSLKEEGVLDCSHEFLRRTLISLGFTWKKCQSRHKALGDVTADKTVATSRQSAFVSDTESSEYSSDD